jgi:energy-coupling factor transport system substrate-specific component
MRERLASLAIYGLSTALGVAAFLYPFFAPLASPAAMGQAHANDAPLLLTAWVVVCFGAVLVEAQGQAGSAKMVALLGVLVSINALLRFVEVAIPGPGGFSPIFFLIVTTGYVFGGRFGFLMGALTLLVSALVTAGMGPWLPYQMFAAGWIGMSAPVCRPLVRLVRGAGGSPPEGSQGGGSPLPLQGGGWREVAVLALFGGVWGLIFGAVMNLWFWPYASGPAEQHWQTGASWMDGLTRYAAFYLATSLVWDVLRLVGNAALTFAFALPTLRALRRFQQRFAFSYQPTGPVTPRECTGTSP